MPSKPKILVQGATGQIGKNLISLLIANSYAARLPEEFYRSVLAAGAEPAYMKCVFDLLTELTNGTAVNRMKSLTICRRLLAANRGHGPTSLKNSVINSGINKQKNSLVNSFN